MDSAGLLGYDRGPHAATGPEEDPPMGLQCANCRAPLPADQPVGNNYCAKCRAAWQRGNAAPEESAPEDDATSAVAAQCANCRAPLPADQPVGNNYCAKCMAAWQRGNAAREPSGH
jgi:hypothetical protein